ncbi:fasciclin domain-containing protein [Toxoplasma gondii FOU]|uniref:Fasciclin domain-containing protein n=3 Tax=Toxoplasma gondii TaxID=5811 RepID=A0A086LAZ5_TOXGO|nr:fasciclin domain-containing protein [Toxoplasma gondii FOU]PUA91415.1 fasciclin domain-containing protein [Toxoplasma gondii TgCATBr9]RQX68279.1 fasciclin domain-containing protein [Toxoplasma gondii CAST]
MTHFNASRRLLSTTASSSTILFVAVLLLSAYRGVHCGRAAPTQPPVQQTHRGEASQQSAAVTFNSGVMGTTMGGSTGNPSINHLASVQDHAAMDPDLSELNKLMQDCGATFYLEQTRDMTMFMPTNSAIKALLPLDLHQLPWEVKWRLLQYHIVPQDIINVEEIPLDTSKSFSTWEGSTIKVTHKRRGQLSNLRGQSAAQGPSSLYLVNDISTIVSDPPRIENFNGASYKIDRVIIPPDMDLRSVEAAPVDQRQNPEVRQQEQREHRARGSNNANNRSTTRPAAKNRGGREEEGSENTRGSTGHGNRQQRHQRVNAELGAAETSSAGLTPVGQESKIPVGNGSQAPDFLQSINQQHARWNQDSYLGPRVIGDSGNTAAVTEQATHGIVNPSSITALGLPTMRSTPVPPVARSQSSIAALAIDEETFPEYPPNSIQISQTGPRPSHFGVPFSPENDGTKFTIPPHPFEALLVGTVNAAETGNGEREATHMSTDEKRESGTIQGIREEYGHEHREEKTRETHSALQEKSAAEQEPETLLKESETKGFDPHVVSTSIAALGLTDGLLPEEELLTHFWGRPTDAKNKDKHAAGRENASASQGGVRSDTTAHTRHQQEANGGQAGSGPLGDLTSILGLPGDHYRL